MIKKLALTLILLLSVIGIVVLTACSDVQIESISIDPSSEFKTEYSVGDELDLTGILIVIKRTDGIESTVALTDIRQDITVLNFKSDKPKESLAVIVEYKGQQAQFEISISDVISSSLKYSVSFETGEGNQVVEPQEVSNFGTASLPADPVRPGYAFDGWYKERTYNNPWNFNVDKVVSDTVLYAKWAKVYTVTFYPTEGDDLTPIVRYVKAGDTLSSVPSVPEIDGKVGTWARSVFSNIQSNISTESVYVVKTFTVTFCYMDTDGTTLKVLRVFNNVPYATNMSTSPEYSGEILKVTPPTYINNTRFSGNWNTAFNNIVSNLTVQAVYVSKEYDISFNLNYQTENNVFTSYEDVVHGNVIEPPVESPIRPGFSFAGWYKDAGCTLSWNFELMTVGRDETLYAKWIKEYQVYFLISPQDSPYFPNITNTQVFQEDGIDVTYKVYQKFPVRENQSITKPDSPKRTGYTSIWDTDDAAFNPVLSDLKVVALFTIENYLVEFCTEDGTVIDSQTIPYGESAVVPQTVPPKTGYNFSEWREDYTQISGNLKVFPSYIPKEVNVRIYPRGTYVNPETGQNYYEVTSSFDSLIELQDPVPIYANHQFENWYTDEILATKWVLSADIIKQESQVNLYANWLSIYNVRFEDEEGNLVSGGLFEVVHGGKISSMPNVPAKTGQTGKWYIYENGVFGAEATLNYWNAKAIEKNTFVRPKYETIKYLVSFVVDAQQTITSNVEHGQTCTTPNQTSVTNYLYDRGKIFERWEPEGPLSQPVVSNLTFNAISSLRTFTVVWRDANNNPMHTENSVVYGSNAESIFNALNIPRPEKEGHSFTGWSVVLSDPAGPEYGMNPVRSNLTLGPNYQVKSFVLNASNLYSPEGKIENENITDQYNSFASFGSAESDILDPIRTGYTFTGWNSSRFVIERTFYNGVYYWVITNPNTAQVGTKYYDNGRLILYKNEIYREDFPNDPRLGQESWQNSCGKLEMNTENGWLDLIANPQSLGVKSIALPGELIHVYGEDADYSARYQINSYTISFNVSPFAGDPPLPFTATYGTLPVVPQSPNWPGYVFLGWFLESEFTNRWDTIGGLSTQPLSSSYTVYARWEAATVGATQGITYALNDQSTGYIVTNMANVESSLTDVIVPNYYNGLPVIGIGYRAIYSNPTLANNLVSINLPNTLYQIANNAFEDCISLVSIEIPAYVRIITDNAFHGCVNLESVEFRQGTELQEIGNFAFSGNTKLADIVLPDSLIAIGEKAFYGCNELISIQIPASVISIGNNAFASCAKLANAFFLSASPINLGSDVFMRSGSSYNFFKVYVNEVSLYASGSSWANDNWHILYDIGKIINIEDVSVDGLWSFGFDGTSVKLIQYLGSEEIVTVPSRLLTYYDDDEYSVSRISNYIFDERIKQVSFDSTVEFEKEAFSCAPLLQNITLRVVENYIPSANFDLSYVYNSGGVNLTKFSVSSSKPLIDIFGGVLPTKLKEVEIIEKDEYIVANMFMNCTSIETVRFNTSILEIRQNAFYGCTSLQSVYIKTRIGSVLTTIGADAFYGNYSLDKFYISDEIDIEVMVEGLPKEITSIGQNAFHGTKWLNDQPSGMVIIGDGILYTYKQHVSLSKVVIIPEEVKIIMDRAFYGNTYITHVIPENIMSAQLKYIGESAFRYCSALEAVAVPAGFISFGNYAFESATKLGTLVLFDATFAPLMGADFIANTLRRGQMGSTVPGIELFVDYDLDVVARAVYDGMSNSLGIGVNYVQGLNISYGPDNNNYWIYSDGSIAGTKIIKFFGILTDCFVPESIENAVTEIANNAFSRAISQLGLHITASAEPYAFAGLTNLTNLTISAPNFASVNMDSDLLYSLLNANSALTSISSAATYSIKEVLEGRVLPSHIITVNILEDQEVVEAEFLKDCSGVQYINILSIVDDELLVTPLETELDLATITERNILIQQIKQRAFSGTGWMNNIPQDFIVVLDGVLVDYKGVNNVLTIPTSVKTIGYGVFKENTKVEIVYIPSSVVTIEGEAFADSINLTKVFLAHEVTIPDVEQNSFTVGYGREIFVKETKLADYQADTTGWLTFAPKIEPDIPLITKEIERNFRRSSLGNLLLEVRIKSYLIDTQSSGGSACLLTWHRDSYITYDIPDDTPSYNKQSLVLSLYPQVSVEESSSVVIPSSVEEQLTTYTITDLGNNVLMSSVIAATINIDDTVTEFSFSNLRSIKEVTILGTENLASREVTGKELTSFINNSGLSRLNYLGSVKLDDLLEIVLEGDPGDLNLRPESLIEVGIIPGALSTVDEMLKDWVQISTVYFPQSILSLGVNSLHDTSWYANYYSTNYGSDFVVAADKVLYQYKGTSTTVMVPANVQIINTGAFSQASGTPGAWVWNSSLAITTLRFAQGSRAHSILAHAFHGCTALNNFNASENLRFVGDAAFEGTQFVVENDLLIVGGSFAQGKTVVKYVGNTSVTSITLPADVKTIAAGAFKNLTSLQSVSWGGEASMLTHIGEEAFYGCTLLATLPLSEFSASTPNLSSIGKDAFYGTTFINPNATMKYLRADGKYVLYRRQGAGPFIVDISLYSVTPGGISDAPAVELNAGASLSQRDMYSLLSMPSVVNFKSDGSTAIKDLIGSSEILTNITALFFFDNVTAITSDYAKGWYSISSINWPVSGLSSVGRDAFTGTSWIESVQNDYVTPGGANPAGILIKYKGVSPTVYIDHRITSLSADAFRGNEDITSVEFAPLSPIAEFPPSAFSGCLKLEDIIGIPSSVSSIGQDAFKDTPWLASKDGLVIINGLLVAYRGASESVVIPKEVTKIYPYVFAGNNIISSLEFNKYSMLDRLEANSFANCTMLTSVKFSENMNYVDVSAFLNTPWLSLVQTSTNGGFITYEDSYLKIYKLISYVGTKTTVTLPSQTTEIGPYTFRNNRSIIRVTIDKGLTIPSLAFDGCSSLSTIDISINASIQDNAFKGTPWYTSRVDEFVLAGNGYLIKYNRPSGVTDVVLPSSVKGITSDVFRNNSIITSIDFRNTSIQEIPSYAFSGATNLSTIWFNSGVTRFGYQTFYDTAWRTAQGDYIVVNGTLVDYKGSSSTIEIPSSVMYIPSYVFANNLTITSLAFDANPLVLADYAFSGCTNLSSITNIGLVTSLGANTLRGTGYYTDNASANNGYVIINGILLGYLGASTEILIPSTVSIIADNAFSSSNITNLSFAERTSEIVIGEKAFLGSVNLTNVNLTEKIKEIKYRAFYNTYWQDNSASLFITAGNKLLMYIGRNTNIEIASNITSMAYGVFTANKSITSVKFNTTSQNEFFLPDNSFNGCSLLNSVTLPRNTFIGENAFKGTLWLTGRGEFAHYNNKLFAYNGQSTTIVLPSNLVGVYNYVFRGNTNLSSINFSSTQTISLANGEFVGCSALSTVLLNNSLQELKPSAFSGTPWINNYSINNGNTKFIILNGTRLLSYISTDPIVVIPSGITYIGKNVFTANTTITSISFAELSAMIPIPDNAFNGCSSLSSVTITGYVEEVGVNAFKDTPWYSALPNNAPYINSNKLYFFKGTATEYTVPANITHIGTNAFLGSGITTLNMLSTAPCTLGRGAVLAGITTINVPDANALTLYKNHSAWVPYSNYIRITP